MTESKKQHNKQRYPQLHLIGWKNPFQVKRHSLLIRFQVKIQCPIRTYPRPSFARFQILPIDPELVDYPVPGEVDPPSKVLETKRTAVISKAFSSHIDRHRYFGPWFCSFL